MKQKAHIIINNGLDNKEDIGNLFKDNFKTLGKSEVCSEPSSIRIKTISVLTKSRVIQQNENTATLEPSNFLLSLQLQSWMSMKISVHFATFLLDWIL